MRAYTLIKLSVSASRGSWVISSVDLGDMVPLDGRYFIHGQISRERNRQVVPKGQDLAALVLQVVDELRVFTVFACQDILRDDKYTYIYIYINQLIN